MSTFQIVQMDPDAAKWLGFAKQQCKRIMDNGTKDFYREWPLGDATVKAKSYGGTVKLWLVAGGVTDFVGVAMPNPVPYRGVSIGTVNTLVFTYTPDNGTQSGYAMEIQAVFNGGVISRQTSIFNPATGVYTNAYNPVNQTINNGTNPPGVFTVSVYSTAWWLAALAMAGGGAYTNYVRASDGTVLASEVQTTTTGPAHTYYVLNTAWDGTTVWNGDAYCDMYVDLPSNPIDHRLTFTVPEDCIYPVPVTPPDVFKARRKAWFLKNSTEFIAALKGKFQPGAAGVTRAELQTGALPASWDYQIKTQISKYYSVATLADGSHPGRHAVMPIIMTITSAADVIVSDTSAGLTQAGTMVTKRTTTFAYTDVDGLVWSAAIDGTLTQAVVQYQPNFDLTVQAAYLNWYVPTTAPANETLLMHQFLRDRAAYGIGLLWNGVIQQGYNITSMFGSPGNPLTYAGYIPAYPTYSNTLVSTAPDIFLQYHNTVIPTYVANTAQSSTVMNNSAMYHVKQIKLRLFAPAPGGISVGLFADQTDADGATQIAYYGEATLSFDWTTGSITVSKWSPKQDANGNDAPTVIDLPTGYSYFSAGVLYFVELVKSTIAGAGQTLTAAGDAAYTVTYTGLPYTVAAKTAGAKIIKAAVLAAPPVDPLASPLVASVSNITAALPSAVTAAVAAVRATYSTSPPDASLVRYYTLNAIQTLTPAYNCAIGYVWGSAGAMWPDVAEYWKAKNTRLKAGIFDQVLYTVMQGKQITPPP